MKRSIAQPHSLNVRGEPSAATGSPAFSQVRDLPSANQHRRLSMPPRRRGGRVRPRGVSEDERGGRINGTWSIISPGNALGQRDRRRAPPDPRCLGGRSQQRQALAGCARGGPPRAGSAEFLNQDQQRLKRTAPGATAAASRCCTTRRASEERSEPLVGWSSICIMGLFA